MDVNNVKSQMRKGMLEYCIMLLLHKEPAYASDIIQCQYLQPIITQYFIDNKSEIWLLFLIAHSKR